MGCNGYNVIDLGVMVPAEQIVETAVRENVDIVALSGLITPSLDEMINVVKEMGVAGLDIPVLIAGATTSPLHTALKIAPCYGGPVVYVKDVSQNVVVAAELLGTGDRKSAFIARVQAEQERLREETAAKNSPTLRTLEESRANKLNLF